MANLLTCIDDILVITNNVWHTVIQHPLFQLIVAMTIYRSFICPIVDRMKNKL